MPPVYIHPKARPGSSLVPDEVPWAIEFRMIETGETFHVPVRSAITIGRSDQETAVKPDVDLTPYGGYQKGVSRRHAIILVRDNHLIVRGLSTTNGTWINGALLATGEESPLRDGDELMIGRLLLMVGFIAAPVARR
jgi:pSer/pThr/pTyr-binding forkhead associated (FHA) protein